MRCVFEEGWYRHPDDDADLVRRVVPMHGTWVSCTFHLGRGCYVGNAVILDPGEWSMMHPEDAPSKDA